MALCFLWIVSFFSKLAILPLLASICSFSSFFCRRFADTLNPPICPASNPFSSFLAYQMSSFMSCTNPESMLCFLLKYTSTVIAHALFSVFAFFLTLVSCAFTLTTFPDLLRRWYALTWDLIKRLFFIMNFPFGVTLSVKNLSANGFASS